MPGLLLSAYQKLYSALSNLERFDKEANFFDNISAIDNFFNEYRNITFVMQASLKHTDFFGAYERNRDLYLTDHWFVEKRNETKTVRVDKRNNSYSIFAFWRYHDFKEKKFD